MLIMTAYQSLLTASSIRTNISISRCIRDRESDVYLPPNRVPGDLA